MEILVVVKESNYDIHGPRVEHFVQRGRLDRRILDRLLIAHKQHYKTVEAVKAALDFRRTPFEVLLRKQMWPRHRDFSVILTVGGDGTVLYSSQHLYASAAKVVGIRSTEDSVGFLCAYDFGQEAQMVDDILADRLKCAPVQRMQAKITFADDRLPAETLPVLNDLLFSNSNPALTTRYLLKFGQHEEVQRSSGVWVSTAVGSTAAVQAAGGMPQSYDSKLLQFRPRELFRPPEHIAELEGALFDPDQTPLLIENYCESAILALDGQHGSVNLGFGDTIEFRRAAPLMLALSRRLVGA